MRRNNGIIIRLIERLEMEEICSRFNLFHNHGGVIRIPFLIQGKPVFPPEMGREEIESAFGDADKDTLYRKLPGAQIIREPVIDRQHMKNTGEYVYQVLPLVSGRELIETDFQKLVRGPYALSVEDILDYLSSISDALNRNDKLLREVRETCRLTAEYPDALLDAWFASFSSALDREEARSMIDHELSLWGKPGTEFLNGWVEVPSSIMPGLTAALGQGIFNKTGEFSSGKEKTLVRAMPTRQLHITAGNAPEVPVVSALRALLTKSSAVIKLPSGAVLTGSLFALAAAVAQPDHPLTQNLSVIYWPGGDSSVENILFAPGSFDRIVVWGSPDTVASVQSRALFTRTVCLNPRYGVSLIGREVFDTGLEEVARKASTDSLIYNQKACTASLVHYVEGTEAQVNLYAEALCRALSRWDNYIPQFIPPSARGQIRRLQKGKYSFARWYTNIREGDFTSGVAVIPDEFDILDHPACRLVVVRPVKKLEDALKYLSQFVSTAGVYPEERRTALRDIISARGVSNVFPLGQCERLYAGMPHDGMPVLSQLVDWKNG